MPGPDLDAASKTVARFALAASGWGDGRSVATLPADPASAVASANALFDEVSAVDAEWHTEVFAQKIPYSEEALERVTSLYQVWGEAAQVLLDHLESPSDGEGVVPGLDLLKENIREVRGILTPDDEFFNDDDLVARRDEAIDARRRGETWPLEELLDESADG